MASHVKETPLTNGELLLEIRGLAVDLQRRLVNYAGADEETALDDVADAGLILALRAEELFLNAWSRSREHRVFFQSLRGDKEAWEEVGDAS